MSAYTLVHAAAIFSTLFPMWESMRHPRRDARRSGDGGSVIFKTKLGTVRSGLVESGGAWFGWIGSGKAEPGTAWFGEATLGGAWLGLAWVQSTTKEREEERAQRSTYESQI